MSDSETGFFNGDESPERYNIKHVSHLNPKKQATVSPEKTTKETDMSDLAAIMKQGFQNLEKSFVNLGSDLVEKVGQCLDDRLENAQEEILDTESDEHGAGDLEEGNFFKEISEELLEENKTGPALSPLLANVVNKALSTHMKEDKYKDKSEKYLRPKNLDCAIVPKVNRPVWDGMRKATRITDCKLQQIQTDVLKSVVPICKVISELFENRNNPENLDPKQLVSTLSDSFAFIGCANENLTLKRKDFIKGDLPKNMQGICDSADKETPSEFLFGENLNSKIKEVVELNKLSTKFDKPYEKRNFYRGGRQFRGRYTRGGRKFFPRHRSAPYNNPRKDFQKTARKPPSKD